MLELSRFLQSYLSVVVHPSHREIFLVKTIKCRLKTSLLEWWQLISEKRCDDYAHSQEDEYNEALKEFLQ
jgi:hypothetical protein